MTDRLTSLSAMRKIARLMTSCHTEFAIEGALVFAASWSSGGGDEPEVIGRFRRLFPDLDSRSGPGWFLAASRSGHLSCNSDLVLASPVRHLVDRSGGRLISMAAAADEPDGSLRKFAERLAPPFRYLAVNRNSGTVVAVTDDCGLGHLFSSDSSDVKLYSSSARLLARLTDARPDGDALLLYSQLGVFPFGRTPWGSITKIEPVDPTGASLELPHGDQTAARSDLRDAFVGAVDAMLRAAPDAAIELSGGLDCRLILAAMSKDQRRGRRALTLFDPQAESSDATIARRIARDNDLAHELRPLRDFSAGGPEEVIALLRRATLGYDCMGNPVDKVPLMTASRYDDVPVRFGGQNGEILRGFYHPLQPLRDRTSPVLTERLVAWRLVANDRVSPALISPDVTVQRLGPLLSQFQDELAGFGGDWGTTIDRIYLRLRMQAWAGNAASSSLVDRIMLLPFFDPGVIEAAFRLTPDERSQSRAAFRLLGELDPALAAMPLDSGLVPSRQIAGGVISILSRNMQVARKFAGKVWQQARKRARGSLGGSGCVNAWYAAEGFRQLDCNTLANLGLFDPETLDGISTGKVVPERTDLGFLLLCEAAGQV